MNAGDRGRITGIASLIIETEDLAPMLRFYRDVLGLPTRSERDDHFSFEWGDFRLLVSLHSDIRGRSRDPLRIMLNFTVDDIHAAFERLRAAGIEFSRPPEQEEWGGWIATLHDPDGNTLQLFQLPER
jgi:catechol 2,3-dioxygenase-like lactoylglutathione lyase family enzyme